jgi:CubicO group peptidase (beta-lactamase class C family)
MLLRGAAVLVCAASIAAPDGFADRANRHVQAFVDAGQFHGAVLFAKGGEPVLRAGYGLANREWDIPNTPSTKYRLGSITKQFTAVAMLQLVEAGKATLDDPVSKHWPEAPQSWSKVTIHHLLNHTSGIPSYTDDPEFWKRMMIPLLPLEVIALTKDKPLQFAPGEGYKYNNTGYTMLGWLIEKLSGETYAGYLRKHVLDPAAMHDTGYETHSEIIKRRASGYAPDGTNARYIDMTLPFSGGALYSTVDDMLKWDRFLESKRAGLTEATFQKMITPGRDNYAYGWDVKPLSGRKAMHHGGGIPGFNSHFIRMQDDKIAVVVLGNVNGLAPSQIARDLVALYYGATVKPPSAARAQSPRP